MLRSLAKSRSRMGRTYTRWSVVTVVCCGTLYSCDAVSFPTQQEPEPEGMISVLIALSKPAAANIARAEIVVTATGMTTVREDLTVSGNAISGTVRGIPAGSNRLFTINGYSSSGSLTYTGSSTAAVTAGQQVTVRITVRAAGGTQATVSLTVVSPVVANYDYSSIKGPVTISGEVSNVSTQTALNVRLLLVARNSSGAAMGQTSEVIGSVRPGRNYFTMRFFEDAFASRAAPISRVDYTIEHSLGGPDTGSVTVTE